MRAEALSARRFLLVRFLLLFSITYYVITTIWPIKNYESVL